MRKESEIKAEKKCMRTNVVCRADGDPIDKHDVVHLTIGTSTAVSFSFRCSRESNCTLKTFKILHLKLSHLEMLFFFSLRFFLHFCSLRRCWLACHRSQYFTTISATTQRARFSLFCRVFLLIFFRGFDWAIKERSTFRSLKGDVQKRCKRKKKKLSTDKKKFSDRLTERSDQVKLLVTIYHLLRFTCFSRINDSWWPFVASRHRLPPSMTNNKELFRHNSQMRVNIRHERNAEEKKKKKSAN